MYRTQFCWCLWACERGNSCDLIDFPRETPQRATRGRVLGPGGRVLPRGGAGRAGPGAGSWRPSPHRHVWGRFSAVTQAPLPLQARTSPTKPKALTTRPTRTQPSSTPRAGRTTRRRRRNTSSRAALVPMRCPTVDGYCWPYLNATETVILELQPACVFFFKEKQKRWVEMVRPGGSGVRCVKIFLVSTLCCSTPQFVWVFFFWPGQLGFSLVKSLQKILCLVSFLFVGAGGGWAERGSVR